jgi:hypothetical protein
MPGVRIYSKPTLSEVEGLTYINKLYQLLLAKYIFSS